MRLSIRGRIFLAFVVVQIVSAALILGWYFYTVNDELRALARSNAEEAVLEAVAATQDYFGPPEATARVTAALLSGEVLDRSRPDQLERFFVEQLRQAPYVAGLFVGYPDGAFHYVSRSDEHAVGGTRYKQILVDDDGRRVNLAWRDADFRLLQSAVDPEDPYDPRGRTWYRAAAEQGALVWTEPYVFFTARKPGITAAVPVLDGTGALRAVVGLDIELSAVSRFLAQVGFRSSGSAFILSPQGEVLAHGQEEVVLAEDPEADGSLRFRRADELPGVDGAVGRAVAEDLDPAAAGSPPGGGVPSVFEQTFEDQDYFVATEGLDSAKWPWRVVAVIRASGFMGALGSVNLLLVGVLLFTTGFACVVGFFVAANVGRPLAALRRDAAIARQGNFELMSEGASGVPEIDETRAALKALAEEKRGLGPR